jgi:hypothetical protein
MSGLPARRKLQEQMASSKAEAKENYGNGEGEEGGWKNFQGEPGVGNLLRKLYTGGQKPVVNYPKLRVKRDAGDKKPFVPGGGKIGVDCRSTQEGVNPRGGKVAVPAFNGPKRDYHPIDHVPKRKGHADIKADSADAAKRDYFNPGVVRPMCTAQEKTKLQTKFTYLGGKALPDGLLPGGGDLPMAAPKVVSEKSSHDDMFEKILKEIEERKAYLETMTALGKREEHEARIQGEIQDRVKDLETLHNIIEAEKNK